MVPDSYGTAAPAGRVSHSSLVGGSPTVSASPVGMAGALYVEGGVKAAYKVPRELRTDELPAVVGAFADAAEQAVKVGGGPRGESDDELG